MLEVEPIAGQRGRTATGIGRNSN